MKRNNTKTKTKDIEFGTRDLLQPKSMYELSRDRHAEKWTIDPDLAGTGYMSPAIYRKVGTISNIFGVRSGIVLNSAIDRGAFYVQYYREYCGDDLEYANIFKIMKQINKLAPLYEVDVEEGTNAHRPFFGALDTATNDYKRYLSTHLVQSKDRKKVRIEKSSNFNIMSSSLRWIDLTYRDALDAIVMSGLVIDSKLDPDSWNMYKEYIPEGYIGVPGAFIRSMASISEIIQKSER